MAAISEDQLAAILTVAAAKAKVTLWIGPLNDAMEEWAINTPQRQAAFLAQILHESGELQHLSENLNYKPETLVKIWPTHFTADEAQEYGHNPEKIANRAYANRMGNSDEASGDGWRYRGRGLIQLTGHHNYDACGKALKVDLQENPDYLSEPTGAGRSAAWFWSAHGLNELADDPSADSFKKITMKINGGTTGLEERTAHWEKAKEVLGAN